MSDDDGTPDGRRGLLKRMVGLGGAAIAGLVGVPTAGYLADPLLRKTKRKDDFRVIGETGALRDDRPVALPVIGEQVDAWTRAPEQLLGTVWVRKAKVGLTALSAECPHLGCRIGFDEEHQKFSCPCHASFFRLDGSVETGPSPRPMDALEVRIKDENIEVRFKRFRTQSAEQTEIG